LRGAVGLHGVRGIRKLTRSTRRIIILDTILIVYSVSALPF
jgi:hypothetical protein